MEKVKLEIYEWRIPLKMKIPDTLITPILYRGIFKYKWLNICSIHKEINFDCEICNSGYYKNTVILYLNGLFFKLFPKLWIWNANRFKNKFLRHR